MNSFSKTDELLPRTSHTKGLVPRVWLATFAAVGLFAVFELVKTILRPDISIISSHVITVIAAGVLTFFVSRYALSRYQIALAEADRQARITEESNRLLSGILAGMREGVLIVNSDLDIVLYNDACGLIVKLPPREGVAGAAPSTPLHLTNATRDPDVNNAFHQTLNQRMTVGARFETIGGGGRVYKLSVAPLGQTLAVGVFFEITELERLEKVRREFFANLSHELRTPLTVIIASAETLLEGAINDEENRMRFVERLHRQALRMSELVRDISDLSAIESGEIALSIEPVLLSKAIADVASLLEPRAAERSIIIRRDAPGGLAVNADRFRLEQILFNLIDNAMKFNRDGGSVTVTARVAGGQARIEVEDTGVGISASDLPRIFERFYRVDKSRSRKPEGAGLGLAIVKHLVHAHGGEITATSEIGSGSRFVMILPLASSAKENHEVHEAREETNEHAGQ